MNDMSYTFINTSQERSVDIDQTINTFILNGSVDRSFYFESACTSSTYIELFLRINLLLVGFFRVFPVSVKFRDFVLLKWSWAGNTFL